MQIFTEMREAIPSNEEFGRDKSRAIVNYQDALRYFDELTKMLHEAKITGIGKVKLKSNSI
jgi:hypothetical protein